MSTAQIATCYSPFHLCADLYDMKSHLTNKYIEMTAAEAKAAEAKAAAETKLEGKPKASKKQKKE